MNDEIDSQTYKRCYKKFAVERSVIQSQIDSLTDADQSQSKSVKKINVNLVSVI